MSWDPVWEEIFSSQEWGRYPPEELIRFVARHFYRARDRGAVKILELGCGPGANVWYLAREGFAAHGIDGSATAVRQAEERLAREGLKADLCVGDVTQLDELFPAARFDAVIEVGCLVCNRLGDVARILDRAAAALRPGGRIFSVTLAAGSWGDGTGEEVEPGTFAGVTEGPAAGKGLCHFFTREEIETLFGGRFADLEIDLLTRTVNNGRGEIRHWLVDGRVQN